MAFLKVFQKTLTMRAFYVSILSKERGDVYVSGIIRNALFRAKDNEHIISKRPKQNKGAIRKL